MEKHPGPIHQLRLATRSPGALALGAVLGAFVPVASYVTVHDGGMLAYEGGRLHVTDWTDPRWLLVLGALTFSAKSVYQWAHAAFDDVAKALGFTVICEGVLLMSTTPWLGWTAIAMLTLVNVMASSATLALRDQSDTLAPAPAQLSQVRSLTEEVSGEAPELDPLYERALAHVRATGRCSGRSLQKGLNIGSARALELARRLTSEGALASDAAE